MKSLRRWLVAVYATAVGKARLFSHNAMYVVSIVLFTDLVTLFFTSLMGEGQPENMPVGVVDLDRSTTSRSLTRRLDAFQTSRVVAHYESVESARKAMQKGEIYG